MTWWDRPRLSRRIFSRPMTCATSGLNHSGEALAAVRRGTSTMQLISQRLPSESTAMRVSKRSKKRGCCEDDAEIALAALQRAARSSVPIASPSAGASNDAPIILGSDADDGVPQTAAVAPPETAPLRKSLLRLAKQALGFRDSGAPKPWRVEAPGVYPNVFAALAGRPSDSALRTFVKVGAHYSHEADCRVLFGCAEADLLRNFKREGVGIQICDEITLKYKPSDMTLTLHGVGEIVCDKRTMGGF